MNISPESGLIMSIIILMIVVLPAPLGPIKPKISPCPTLKEMPLTTLVSLKDLLTPETATV